MNIPGQDAINNKIITLLHENARYTYSEIAEKIGGITRVAVKNRIQKMEEEGLIVGYQVKTAAKYLDSAVEFMFEVEPSPSAYDYTLDILGYSTDWIRRVVATTGQNHIIAFGLAPNMKEVDAVYTKLHKIFSRTRFFEFKIIASTYKDVDGGITYVKTSERKEDADSSNSGRNTDTDE